jgi:hypothetical protein
MIVKLVCERGLGVFRKIFIKLILNLSRNTRVGFKINQLIETSMHCTLRDLSKEKRLLIYSTCMYLLCLKSR